MNKYSLLDKHVILNLLLLAYVLFCLTTAGNVSEYESLFSYHGSSYAAFQHLDHTPLFVAQLNPTVEQIAVCREDQQCLYDFVNTGNKKLAVSTIEIANKNTKDSEILSKKS